MFSIEDNISAKDILLLREAVSRVGQSDRALMDKIFSNAIEDEYEARIKKLAELPLPGGSNCTTTNRVNDYAGHLLWKLVLIGVLTFAIVLLVGYLLTLIHLRKEMRHSYDVEAGAFVAGLPIGFGLRVEVARSTAPIPIRRDDEIVVVQKEAI